MSVTTSSQLNPDQLQTALVALQTGAAFTSAGGALTSTDPKTITAVGATDTQLQQAITTAAAQYADYAANLATMQANLTNRLNSIETWLAANPGVMPNGTQFDFFAHAVCGLARITLGLLGQIGQAT